jgi:hypothetical protein
MTVSSTTNRIEYTADGSAVTFAYPFKIFEDADLDVYVDSVLKTLSTDYTVTGAGSDSGGNVVFTSPPASSKVVLIIRVLDQTQETDLPTNDKFPSTAVENALDKATMLAQELAEVDRRALKLAVTSLYENLTLVDPQASKFLRWKADLTGLENADVVSSGSITVPVTVAEGGTGSTTAAGARTALDAAQQFAPEALTPGASPAIDASLSDTFTLVPNQNFSLPNPTNPTNGQRIIIRIKQDATGSRLLTSFGSKWRGGADIPLTDVVLSTAANAVDYLGAYYNSTDDKWDVIAFTKGY